MAEYVLPCQNITRNSFHDSTRWSQREPHARSLIPKTLFILKSLFSCFCFLPNIFVHALARDHWLAIEQDIERPALGQMLTRVCMCMFVSICVYAQNHPLQIFRFPCLFVLQSWFASASCARSVLEGTQRLWIILMIGHCCWN